MTALRKIGIELFIDELDTEGSTVCDVHYYYYPCNNYEEDFVDITYLGYNGYKLDTLLNTWMWADLEEKLLNIERNMYEI